MRKTEYLQIAVLFLLILITILSRPPLPALAEDERPRVIRFTISFDEPTVVDQILYAAFRRMGYNVTFDALGMTSAIMTANSGERDGLYAQVPGLEKNFPNLVMVPEEVTNVKFEAYARKDSSFEVTSWADLAGLRVGTLFQKYYIHNNLPKNIASLVQKETVPLLIDALVRGECDVIVMSNSLLSDVLVPYDVRKAGLTDRIPSFPYLNKKYADLAPALARTIKAMKDDGTYKRIAHQVRESDASEKTILRVASFYADMTWEKELSEGIEDVFALDPNVQTHTVYLNSNRVLDNDSRAKLVFTALRASIMKKIPDAVIISDQNAMTFMFDYYGRLFTGVPVVFCGAGEFDPADAWKMEGNVTGLTEEPSARETVLLMLKLFPRTKNIFVINDYKETGRLWKGIIERQLKPLAGIVKVTHNKDLPFSQLIETIKKLPKDTLVLTGFYFVDGADIAYSEESIGERIDKASPVPVFGLMDTSIGYGQVGGKYTNGKAEGKAAAEMAFSIMRGAQVSSIETRTDGEALNRWIFDNYVLNRWGLSRADLPADALVINRPLSLREANPTAFRLLMLLVSAAVAIIIGLSIFMLILGRKNRTLVETQKNLYTAKDRLERALESAPLAYMLLVGGRVLEANSYLLDNLDIVTGPEHEPHLLDGGVAEKFDEILRENTVAHGAVLQFAMKNGETHRFHVNLATVTVQGGRGVVFWGIDVEERERHRDSLARMQEELQKLVDTVPIPIFISTPEDYKIMYANGSFLEMFGFATREDALGVSMRTFHPDRQPDGRDTEAIIHEYARRALDSGVPETVEVLFSMPDGKELYAQVTSSFVVYRDTACLVVTIWDTTAEKEREDLLVKAAEKEREANQMKSLFLMNMSHEIRTPMNAIIGFSQLGLYVEQSADNADLFRKINVSARNLLTIINDILDFSKIEAEKLDLLTEEFDLEEILINAFMVASERIERKKVEMLVDIDPNVPNRVLGDKTRVWQVLKNLLDNSAKYTEQGHVLLSVHVWAEGLEEGDATFRFVVEDTGLGMSKAQLGRLFAPFEQFHNNAKNNLTGTGLGMPITKQLVELMGGGITVESEVGVGTRATVVLTLRKAKGAISLKERIDADMGNLDAGPVLIADDDECARQIMANIMETVGVPTVCVASGREVFEKVREYEEKGNPFRTVILDYLLGEDNGIEVARELRAMTSEPVRLLMVSAYSKQLLARDIEAAGFRAVIEKPFTPSVFIRKFQGAMDGIEKKRGAESHLRFSGAKVLLCEDNAFNQDVAKGMLGAFGIEPAIAGDGREAIEMLECGEYHLVFMDIMMPIMDGHEATVAIRACDRPYRDIPIVAMTANVMREEVERCLKEGMNGHIGKPMEIQQIYESLLENLPREIVENAEAAVADETEGGEEAVSIEGLDMVAGIARFGGKREKYMDALGRFAATLGDELLPWAEAVAPENREYTRRAVHTLKGVSGNLGIAVLFEETVAFEREFQEGAEKEESYDRLAERCRVMRERILALPDLVREEKPARRAGSAEELRSLVARMNDAFESSQVDLCDALMKEAAGVDWAVGAARMRAVVKAMEEYDFEAAFGLLDNPEGEA